MKRICTRCGREVSEAWCQNPTCPPGSFSLAFEYGEYLGDLKILERLRWFRTSGLYRAERAQQQVFVKVAHDGCQAQLKQEAKILAATSPSPGLPTLRSAYRTGHDAYGKVFFQGDKYYIVYEAVKGQFLDDMLHNNRYPLVQDAAWLIMALAGALSRVFQKTGKLVLNVEPAHILVYPDEIDKREKTVVLRPVLFDLTASARPQEVKPQWFKQYGCPAYLAPELIDPKFGGGQFGPATDVYGLGAVLYEMLAGQPAFPTTLPDDEARAWVTSKPAKPLRAVRTDIGEELASAVSMALEKRVDRRHAAPAALQHILHQLFGDIPAKKKRTIFNRHVALAGLVIVLVAFIILVLLIILSG